MILNYLIKNKDITELSNFKTSAKAKYYFEIHSEEDIDKIFEIYNYALKNNIKLLFIWWGTNILFAFDTFDWIIINNCLTWWIYDKELKIINSFSNEAISDIAKSLFDDGQVLWKRFIWLPGTIWWAVFWNAWCFWLEIENNFLDAKVLNLINWNREVLNKKQMWFKYRNSILKETGKYFIIKARFDLSNLVEKYPSNIDNLYFREHKQPKGNTCGSFFKNPSKENSAWSLIEKSWLKWKKVWWAYFSDLHANFLTSDWTATYGDILKLIELTQKKVKMSFDIDLIPEVRLITN